MNNSITLPRILIIEIDHTLIFYYSVIKKLSFDIVYFIARKICVIQKFFLKPTYLKKIVLINKIN